MDKKIIVFGATGHLGTHISLHLHKLGYDVVPVGHRKNDNGFFAEHDMVYHSINIENAEEFNSLPQKDVYAVVHFAGMLPAAMKGFDATPYVQSIVQGTLNVLEYTRKCGGGKNCLSSNII